MRITVSMEFELEGTYLDAKKPEGISYTVFNFGQLLQKWGQGMLVERINVEIARQEYMNKGDEESKKMAEALADHAEQNIAITKQTFNNYRITGEVDGKKFIFTHCEPGYKEALTIDGELVESD